MEHPLKNPCKFPEDARIHDGDSVCFYDKKGRCYYGIARWAGRFAPTKKWRDSIMKVGIITDIEVYSYDFEDSEPGLNYLVENWNTIGAKAQALVIPESNISVISGGIKQDKKEDKVSLSKISDDEILLPETTKPVDISSTSMSNQPMDPNGMNSNSFNILQCTGQREHVSDSPIYDQHLHEKYLQCMAQLFLSEDLTINLDLSRSELKLQKKIGSGAWGVVWSGTIRESGECVAIKIAHMDLLSQTTIDMLKREVKIMASIQHPNLVKFKGAVINDVVEEGIDMPIIVSELMDMNLRDAYIKIDLKLSNTSLISIFCDVAYGLLYLHQHIPPIIHRDVSAPNVLLKSLQSGGYQAKVSDFGSANFAKQSKTPATGAIAYSAPEMFPQEGIAAPPQQTPKVDVFSYGVLMMEVIVKEMPTVENRHTMLERVGSTWEQMYELISLCTKIQPSERPTMTEITHQMM